MADPVSVEEASQPQDTLATSHDRMSKKNRIEQGLNVGRKSRAATARSNTVNSSAQPQPNVLDVVPGDPHGLGRGNQMRFSQQSVMTVESSASFGEAEPRLTQYGQEQGAGVFADAAAMKEKLREAIGRPKYDVANFYKDTGPFQAIARSQMFENLTLAVIAVNAVWISIDTDHNHAKVPLDADPVFQVAEQAFCLYFTFEWTMRFLSFRRTRDCIKDGWFIFDTCLVAMMVAETWIMTLVLLATSSGGSGGMGDASIVRLVRLLRLTRMARMAKLLVAMPELTILIKGMVVACRSVFFTLVLLVLILYVFGIAFKQLMEDTPAGEMYFRTVPSAMNTLLVHGTLLEGVSSVLEMVRQESFFLLALFLLFILLASLTVMNMLIGILCEVVSVVSAVEKENCLLNFVKNRMQQMLTDSGLDADGDGMINKDEFEKLLDIPEAARALSEVGVDVVGLVDFADFIFGMEGDVELTFADFMEVVLQLRGNNNATVKDIVDLRKFFAQEMANAEEKVAKHVVAMCGGRMPKMSARGLSSQIHGSSVRPSGISHHDSHNSLKVPTISED